MTTSPTSPRTPRDTPRKRLRNAKDTSGLSFRALALVEPYKGIPPGTLSTIYNGGRVPNKYRAQLGYIQPAPRLAIHKEEAWAAYKSILRNMEAGALEELTDWFYLRRAANMYPDGWEELPTRTLSLVLEQREEVTDETIWREGAAEIMAKFATEETV